MSSSRPISSWSLRARLVAATMALLALAFVVVGITTVATLHTALYDRIDAQLAAAAGRAPQSHSDCGKPKRTDVPPGQPIGTINVRICDGSITDSDVLTESGEPDPDLSPYYDTLLTVQPGQPPRTVDLGELGDYRVVARSMPDGAVIVTGLPLGDTQDTLYLVTAVLIGVMALALAAVAVGGTVIIRRALRPLSRVAATATKVSQSRLDRGEVELAQRVAEPDTDPRTEAGQVGAALNRLLDHVGNALEARHASETRVRRFVADASHELRTPLASIRGYAELSRLSGQPVPPEIAHNLRRVESEARRMSVLVDDLLLLARLDSGRPLAHRMVDLSAMLVDAVSDAHAAGPNHEWRLDLPEEPVVVFGDSARLHQVVANLLSNARIHSAEGTTVTVGLAQTGQTARLTVADNGPGIPEGLLPHVFERFRRGDRPRGGSSGLGLSIVSAVVGAHGGTVTVDSAPGRTVFTVELPTSDRADS